MTPTATNTVAMFDARELASRADRTEVRIADFDPFESGLSIPVFEWLLRTPGVTPIDALVYGKLAYFRGKGADRECRPSMSRVASELGIDERDCRKHIVKLERLGLIERIERPGRPNLFRFLNPGSKHPGVKGPGVKSPSVVSTHPPRVKTPKGPRGKTPLQSEETSELTSEHVAPLASLGAQIDALEARYGERELTKRARDACALARRNGKMADTVWLQTLKRLSAHKRASSEYALREFADHHADGSKNEAYMLGIARREDTKPSAAATVAHAAEHKSFGERAAEEVVCDY